MPSLLVKLLVAVGLVAPIVLLGARAHIGLGTDNTPDVLWQEDDGQSVASVAAPIKTSSSLGIETSANGVLVVDVLSGATLFEKNADEIQPLASITKLASALVFLQHNPGFEKIAQVEAGDDAIGGRLQVDPNETMTVRDLFMVSLVGSANNTTNALARITGLSRESFIAEMNVLTEKIGLEHTTFVEPTGLSEFNLSTPRDVVRLAEYAMNNAEIHAALETEEYTFSTINTGVTHRIKSTNDVLTLYPWEKKTIGKTGFINEAGWCLVARAERDERSPIMIAVLGTESLTSRFNEVKGLIEWTYDAYAWPETK